MKKTQSKSSLWGIYRNNFPSRHNNPKTPVPVVNKLIYSKDIFAKHQFISSCLQQGTDKPDVLCGEKQPSHHSMRN